ncbi:hypothetical protein, partial [Arcanobacterium phocae]|uniref:hypothetical protein n=1 Tax=Arcanobacterium phocae TaxID=131112 RepID=UPI001C0F8FAE
MPKSPTSNHQKRRVQNDKASSTSTKWIARRLKDELTGALFVEFTVPTGEAGGKTIDVSLGNQLTLSEMVKELRRYTTELKGPVGINRVAGMLD